MDYLDWAQAHAQGMAAAAARTETHRRARTPSVEVRRHNREHYPCKIKGCKRTAYKGALCRGHWDLVPYADRVALQVDVIQTSRAVAAKHHRRFLRTVQAQLP